MDEMPLLPDSPCKKSLADSAKNQGIVGYGRKSSWTLHFVYNAAGKVLYVLIIVRGESLPLDLVEKIKKKIGNLPIGLTSNLKGGQTDASFISVSEEFLSMLGATESEPGLGDSDGHGSRKTRGVPPLYRRYHFYLALSPSHSSKGFFLFNFISLALCCLHLKLMLLLLLLFLLLF
jgi:hypothetical protein